jgi:hypothetical protein
MAAAAGAGGAPAPRFVPVAAPQQAQMAAAGAGGAPAPRFVLYKHRMIRHTNNYNADLNTGFTFYDTKEHVYESEKEMRDDVLREKKMKKELEKQNKSTSAFPYAYTLDREGRIPFKCEDDEEGCCGSSCTIAGGRIRRRRGSASKRRRRSSRRRR